MVLRLSLPGRPESVRVARQAIERFRARLGEETTERLRLLLSEVVTNSVRHSSAWDADSISVKIVEMPKGIHVEVEDPGFGFVPNVLPPVPGQSSGWGLFLVDRLASDWGVCGQTPTKVWFDVSRAS